MASGQDHLLLTNLLKTKTIADQGMYFVQFPEFTIPNCPASVLRYTFFLYFMIKVLQSVLCMEKNNLI